MSTHSRDTPTTNSFVDHWSNHNPTLLLSCPEELASPSLLSEDEDGIEETNTSSYLNSVIMQGAISKWTNYLHGWQTRFFVLSSEGMAYYKSEVDMSDGCRGNIPLRFLHVRDHSIDDRRLDISMEKDDTIWYLRTPDSDMRTKWVEALHGAVQHSTPGRRWTHSRNVSQLSGISAMSGSSTTSMTSMGTRASPATRMLQLQASQAHMETFRENMLSPIACLEKFYDILHDRPADEGPFSQTDDPQDEMEIGQTDYTNYVDSPLDDVAPLQQPRSQTSWLSKLFGVQQERYRHISEASETSENTTDWFYDESNVKTKIPVMRQPSLDSLQRQDSEALCEAIELVCEEENDDILTERLDKLLQEARHNSLFDIVGAGYTYKANSDGFLSALSETMDIIKQHDDIWRQRVQKEATKRKHLEALIADHRASGRVPGPDFEEGPNCCIDEEEFFDAVDTELDLLEEVDDLRQSLRLNRGSFADNIDPSDPLVERLHAEIEECIADQLAQPSTDEEGMSESSDWELIAEEGEMRVFRSLQEEAPGMVITPLLAQHKVEGVVAMEMADRYWDVRYREDFEHTIDRPPEILKVINKDILILHQLFKRIWPTSQREAVFWSVRRRLAPGKWLVMNQTCTDEQLALLNATPNPESGLVQVKFCIAMMLETERSCSDEPGNCSRDHLSCRVKYTANVNPGGWAPASVLRTIYRREYPSFVRRFAHYVINSQKDSPIPVDD